MRPLNDETGEGYDFSKLVAACSNGVLGRCSFCGGEGGIFGGSRIDKCGCWVGCPECNGTGRQKLRSMDDTHNH